jgi:hypothetical protein
LFLRQPAKLSRLLQLETASSAAPVTPYYQFQGY